MGWKATAVVVGLAAFFTWLLVINSIADTANLCNGAKRRVDVTEVALNAKIHVTVEEFIKYHRAKEVASSPTCRRYWSD